MGWTERRWETISDWQLVSDHSSISIREAETKEGAVEPLAFITECVFPNHHSSAINYHWGRHKKDKQSWGEQLGRQGDSRSPCIGGGWVLWVLGLRKEDTRREHKYTLKCVGDDLMEQRWNSWIRTPGPRPPVPCNLQHTYSSTSGGKDNWTRSRLEKRKHYWDTWRRPHTPGGSSESSMVQSLLKVKKTFSPTNTKVAFVGICWKGLHPNAY